MELETFLAIERYLLIQRAAFILVMCPNSTLDKCWILQNILGNRIVTNPSSLNRITLNTFICTPLVNFDAHKTRFYGSSTTSRKDRATNSKKGDSDNTKMVGLGSTVEHLGNYLEDTLTNHNSN